MEWGGCLAPGEEQDTQSGSGFTKRFPFYKHLGNKMQACCLHALCWAGHACLLCGASRSTSDPVPRWPVLLHCFTPWDFVGEERPWRASCCQMITFIGNWWHFYSGLLKGGKSKEALFINLSRGPPLGSRGTKSLEAHVGKTWLSLWLRWGLPFHYFFVLECSKSWWF